MAKKRPLAPPPSPTDEWGIYDPAKAGMQALYNRLGRPVIRASAAATRRERRRAGRPDRTADGVGMAIQEARRRAEELVKANAAPPPPPAPVPAPPAVAEVTAPVARTGRAKAAKGTKRGPIGAAIAAAGDKAVAPVAPPVAAPDPPQLAASLAADSLATPPRRAPKKGTKTRQAPGRDAAPAPARPAPAVPPPSPRRPRGPVPLAAWAHAVSDSPRPEPKRSEGKGLWRGIFTIPSEVALVEYGRGCRIHRLVIETAPEAISDPF